MTCSEIDAHLRIVMKHAASAQPYYKEVQGQIIAMFAEKKMTAFVAKGTLAALLEEFDSLVEITPCDIFQGNPVLASSK